MFKWQMRSEKVQRREVLVLACCLSVIISKFVFSQLIPPKTVGETIIWYSLAIAGGILAWHVAYALAKLEQAAWAKRRLAEAFRIDASRDDRDQL